jgi:phage N-6-adenine-methyltransferase
MFLHKSGEYWKLSINRWIDGKSKRIHIASLGKQEGSANRALKKLLKDNIISPDEYKTFSERFDTDIWGTPKWVLDLARSVMGDIELDPCTQGSNSTQATRFFTEKDNGLIQPWRDRLWMNPPYNKPLPWIKRLVEFYQSGDVVSAIALVKSGQLNNHGTGELIHKSAAAKGDWKGRLKFDSLREGRATKPPDFDVRLIYWGSEPALFKKVFEPCCYF